MFVSMRGNSRALGDLIPMDTSQMMIPVLIPRSTEPAVSGINSSWLVAGGTALALLASWGIFGSKVSAAKKKAAGGAKRKPKGRKKKLRLATRKRPKR
jgi:hypothetical protein